MENDTNERVEYLRQWRNRLANPVILTSGFMEEVNENGFECQCKEAGYCSVYQMPMSEALHHLCQTDPKKRMALLQYAWKKQSSSSEERQLQHVEMAQEKSHIEEDYAKVDQAMEEIEKSPDKEDDGGGLGSTVERVLSKFGITTDLVDRVLGSAGCGCAKRKKWLNKIFKTTTDDGNFK